MRRPNIIALTLIIGILAMIIVGMFILPNGVNIKLTENKVSSDLSVRVNGIFYKIDDKKLNEKLESLNSGRVANKEASLVVTDNGLSYSQSVVGNKIDTDKLHDYIVENIKNLSEVNLKDFYYPLEEDTLINEYSKYCHTFVEYSNGFRIGLNDFYKYLKVENGKLVIDCPDTDTWLEEIKSILSENLSFTTHSGEVLDIDLDIDSEANHVLEVLISFDSETNRTPISLNDYVEVSISEQHVYVFKDGELVADSPCVTGKCDGHETPKGVFKILNMGHNVGLKPSDSTTTSYVKNWMRFTTNGCGFHDASWRSEFGGDIYINNGSHGCCNLPTDFSDTMYELVYPGMTVIVY